MAKVEFDYDPWNIDKDVLLERPGSEAGYAVIQAGLMLTRFFTPHARDADSTVKPGLDGVIGLLAGALEWCRWYGLSAQEVQSKVRAYILQNKESNAQQGRIAVGRAIERFADGHKETGRTVDPTIVVR